MSLLRFVSDGILPNSYGLTKIYQWCREDMNKLKCLARLQNLYTPKVSLMFRLANVENPDISLSRWAEAGLHLGFHVDLGDKKRIQALADHLPLGSCSIRILVLNSNETHGRFHFDELANTIRLNESVVELSVCGLLSSENLSAFGYFLENVAESKITKLRLKNCVDAEIEHALTELISGGRVNDLSVNDCPSGILAILKAVEGAGPDCTLQKLELIISDDVMHAVSVAGLYAQAQDPGHFEFGEREREAYSQIPAAVARMINNNDSISHLTLPPFPLLGSDPAGAEPALISYIERPWSPTID